MFVSRKDKSITRATVNVAFQRALALLGRGEALFSGLDFPALGYEVKDRVFTGAAMHLVIRR